MKALLEERIAELEAYRAKLEAAYNEETWFGSCDGIGHEHWTGILQSLRGVNDQLGFLRRRLAALS